ncbi:hypothetical protein L1887_05524 [Cichorium endivia]|nr:hypothetical protein L1887_05524 [Cichorium endivia]
MSIGLFTVVCWNQKLKSNFKLLELQSDYQRFRGEESFKSLPCLTSKTILSSFKHLTLFSIVLCKPCIKL